MFRAFSGLRLRLASYVICASFPGTPSAQRPKYEKQTTFETHTAFIRMHVLLALTCSPFFALVVPESLNLETCRVFCSRNTQSYSRLDRGQGGRAVGAGGVYPFPTCFSNSERCKITSKELQMNSQRNLAFEPCCLPAWINRCGWCWQKVRHLLWMWKKPSLCCSLSRRLSPPGARAAQSHRLESEP